MRKQLLASLMVLGFSGGVYAGGAMDQLAPSSAEGVPAAASVPAPKAVKEEKDVWKHVKLTASDGTRITVDYSVLDLAGSVIAAPVWVNVEGGKLGNVRVVLMNYYVTQGPVMLHDTQQIDLKYSGGVRFTGQFQKVLMSEGTYMYGGNLYRQELAVVADGKWLRDPVSNTSNFKFQLVR